MCGETIVAKGSHNWRFRTQITALTASGELKKTGNGYGNCNSVDKL